MDKDTIDFSFLRDEKVFGEAIRLFDRFIERLGENTAKKEGWHYSLATELRSAMVEDEGLDFSLYAEILAEDAETICQNWISWVYSIDASQIFGRGEEYVEQVRVAFDRWVVRDGWCVNGGVRPPRAR